MFLMYSIKQMLILEVMYLTFIKIIARVILCNI